MPCGASEIDKLDCKPHEYYSYMYHSYRKYLHQLVYLGAPLCNNISYLHNSGKNHGLNREIIALLHVPVHYVSLLEDIRL